MILNHTPARDRMVERQIAARGVSNPQVLDAMRAVPREEFVPDRLRDFAYDDRPLPIEESQTISQPYIVAAMIEAAVAGRNDTALEIGTGSGYAAAVLGRIVRKVYTVERHAALAASARRRFERLGYRNIEVVTGDGSLGLPDHAPYNVIIVTAGGPRVPPALTAQLAVGGRLVIPVGPAELQKLVRVVRTGDQTYDEEALFGDVAFVPLIGREAWESPPPSRGRPESLVERVAKSSRPLALEETEGFLGLIRRIGDSRVILIGESTHGTSEFYSMRARVTRSLVERHGATAVALEADWPDAARINEYVLGVKKPEAPWKAFARFPTWMWRNREMLSFVEWLRSWNAEQTDPARRASVFGLDLYSLQTSIHEVLRYLERIDPESARLARHRYGCLSPWERNPEVYGRAVLTKSYQSCEREVMSMLADLLKKRLEYAARDGQDFFDAAQNARVIANSERYYRAMYYGSAESWNLRDEHMFDTLRRLVSPGRRVVVWEHNSHVGDAAATQMMSEGELNLGHLARGEYGDLAYLIGQGTDRGTVAAAREWESPMEVMTLKPSHPESYEHLFHATGAKNFLLPLRAMEAGLAEELKRPRLERAVGVVYRPQSELASHYFQASLPRQFDEFIWFDESSAVTPLSTKETQGMPATFPFGL